MATFVPALFLGLCLLGLIGSVADGIGERGVYGHLKAALMLLGGFAVIGSLIHFLA